MALAAPPGPSTVPSPALAGPYRGTPGAHELRFDPRARAEALQKAQALAPEHCVELARAQRDEAEQSTRRWRTQARRMWDLYQSWVSFPDKEDWQSQVWVPLSFQVSKQATAVIQKGLLDSPEFFGVDGVDERDQLIAEGVHGPLLKAAFARTKFPYKFVSAAELAFITGLTGWLKFRWAAFGAPPVTGMSLDPSGWPAPEFGRTPLRRYLMVEVLPPWSVYWDPDSLPLEPYTGTYRIHERPVGWSFLADGQAAGLFSRVETVKPKTGTGEGSRDTTAEAIARSQGRTWTRSRFRKDYLASEWYGDVLDGNAELVYPDATMTVVNDTLVFGPRDTPCWAVDPHSGRRKWPLLAGCVLPNPLRFEGHGILEAVAPFQTLISNALNAFSDGMNWDVFPEAEVDLTLLDNPDDLERYPGKLWLKHGQGRAFTPAETGSVRGGNILSYLSYVTGLHENGSFVNQFVQGLPGSRSDITKGEVQIKTQQSLGIFDGMARNLEVFGAACVELALDLHCQYLTDWSDPSVTSLVGQRAAAILQAMPPGERMATLRGNFDFTFPGITGMIQRGEQLGRLLQFAQLAASPPYQGLTDPSELLEALRDALVLGDRVQVSRERMIPERQVKRLLATLVQRLRGGPGPVASPGRPGMRPPSMREMEPTAEERGAGAGPSPQGPGAAMPEMGDMEA